MKKWFLAGLVILLAACSNQNDNSLEGNLIESIASDDYAVLVPFDSSPVRSYHGTYLGKADFMEVGARLLEKSKDYFDPKDVYITEGQKLTPTSLGQLVRRESSDNPYGLNPPSGSSFKTGTDGVEVLDAVVVADVVETDFYQGSTSNPQLVGISLALVLNQTLTQADGTQVAITDARLYEYGADMGRKLERFIRTLTDLENTPVYIALYSTQSIDQSLPGHYIGDGYFDGRSGQFKTNSEGWTLFPSANASSLDPVTDASFQSFKGKVLNFIPDAIGVIGEAHYIDRSLHKLNLTLTIQAKTYTEVNALVQYAASLLETFEQGKYAIIVKINSISETLALIQRDASGALSVIQPY